MQGFSFAASRFVLTAVVISSDYLPVGPAWFNVFGNAVP
jgi:hypothetical protein